MRRAYVALAASLAWLLGSIDAVAGNPIQVAWLDSGQRQVRVIDESGQPIRTIPLEASSGGGVGPWDISADGKTLVYGWGRYGYDHQLFARNIETGQTTPLFVAPWCQNLLFLPGSSTQFLFVRDNGGTGPIFLHDLTTKTTSLWLDTDATAAAFGLTSIRYGIAWDDPFSLFAFRIGSAGGGGDRIVMGDVCGADSSHHVCNLRALSPSGSGWGSYFHTPAMTGDGKTVFYWTSANRLIQHDVATSMETQLFEYQGPANNMSMQAYGSDTLVFGYTKQTSPSYQVAIMACSLQPFHCREIYAEPGYQAPSFIKILPGAPLSPDADAGPDVGVECSGPETPVPLTCGASSDPMNRPFTCAWEGPFGSVTGPNPVVLLPMGTHAITLTVENNAGLTDTDEVVVTVRDTTPPVVEYPSSLRVEATGPAGAAVTLPVSARDECGGASVTCSPPSGSVLGLGTTTVSCAAADCGENAATVTFPVTVVDSTPPEIGQVSPSEGVLWQPNHGMRVVSLSASATDLVDSAPACHVESVTSNEPVDGLGDGDTAPDWSITGPLTVLLRAERSGQGSGRIYTIVVRCLDDAGNGATATTLVRVPKSQGKR